MRKTALLLAAVMLASLLGACAADTGAPGGSKTHVNIPLDSIGVTLDAHAYTLRVDGLVLNQIYESMYRYNNDGTYEPALALSHTVSADGLEYTFTLRQGVKFHNGDEMKASDVVFSFQRCLDNAYMATETSKIQKVEAAGDYAVKLTIDSPSSLFERHAGEIKIVSQKVVTEAGGQYGATVQPAGTGPYKMVKYDVNTEIALEAFSDYWRPQPAIKTVRFVPMNDSSTQLIAFENGEFDFAAIPPADWNTIESSGKYQTAKAPGLHQSYLGINVGKTDGPLADQRVRQAIAYACDKVSMVAIACDGLADVADNLMRVGYIDGAQTSGFEYSYNPEKAKALLAEAGYADGFHLSRIEAITSANGRYVKIAQVLQENLAAVGITSDIVQGETASMLPAWKTDRAYDIFVSGFTPTFSYYELRGYLDSRENVQVQFNLNPDIDDDYINTRFDRAITEPDPAARAKLYGEIEGFQLQVAGYVPILHVNSLYAWNKNLHATIPIRTYYIYDWYWMQ